MSSDSWQIFSSSEKDQIKGGTWYLNSKRSCNIVRHGLLADASLLFFSNQTLFIKATFFKMASWLKPLFSKKCCNWNHHVWHYLKKSPWKKKIEFEKSSCIFNIRAGGRYLPNHFLNNNIRKLSVRAHFISRIVFVNKILDQVKYNTTGTMATFKISTISHWFFRIGHFTDIR